MADPGEFAPQAFPSSPALSTNARGTQWAGGDIVGRDKVGGDQVGRDKITYIYEGPAYPRLDYRQEVGRLVAFYTEVFVGRHTEISRLAGSAAEPTPGYLLVEGPPAFGKSALAVRLVTHYETKQWPGPPPMLVYFFIREDGKWHTPDAFCTAVNSQLLDLLGERGGVPPDLQSQRSQLLSLWSRATQAARPERPLLLLVDGLDEQAAGEVTIADLLPGELGPHVHVVVTSRPNPEPLAQVPLEHPLRQAEVLRLHSLGLPDIEQLMESQGATNQVASELAGRLLAVTRGEPLLARFISQDVARGGEPVLAALEQAPPTQVKDYFRKQFKQLDARAEGDTAWEVLGVLLIAYGAMTAEELAGVLAVPVRQIRKAIGPILRFLVGQDRVELMHLELRGVIVEQFSRTERQEYQRRLLAWCASFAADGWPDDTPDYVLDNYARHLQEAGDNEALYRLIDRRWMQLKAAHTHSHQAFARDVLMAIDAANDEDPPNLVHVVRGSLIYATLTSMATSTPSELLGVLTRVGQVSRALGYAALIGDPEKRCSAYRHIATVLFEQEKQREAIGVAEQALAAGQAIRADRAKTKALTQVAQALIKAGHGDLALTAALAIPDAAHRAQALVFVIRSLAQAGHIDQALIATNAIPDERHKSRALTELLEAVALTGQTAQALTIAEAIPDNWIKSHTLRRAAETLTLTGHSDEAFAMAEAIPGRGKAEGLIAVSRITAELGHIDQALAMTEAIPADSGRAQALAGVAQILAEVGEIDKATTIADQALAIANAMPDNRQKGPAFIALGEALTGGGHIDQALTIVEAIPNNWDRVQALIAVAQTLIDVGQSDQAIDVTNQALTIANAMPDNGRKSQTLVEITQVLADVGDVDQAIIVGNQALSIAHTIPDDDGSKVETLTKAARALIKVGKTNVALTVVQQIPDDRNKAECLTEVARALAEAGHTDRSVIVIDQAVTIAKAILNEWDHDVTLTQAVRALAEAGHTNHALTVVEAILDDWHKARALTSLVFAQAQAGNTDQALTIAKAIPDRWHSISYEGHRAQSLIDVAHAFTKASHTEQAIMVTNQALTAAQAMSDSRRKVEILVEVAQLLAELGYGDRSAAIAQRALTSVQGIRENWSKAEALTKVAQTLFEVSHTEQAIMVTNQALTVIQQIPDDRSKAQILVEVAQLLAELGYTDRAAAIVGQSFTVVRTQGRSSFFVWLKQLIPALATTQYPALLPLCSSILAVETWWTG